MKKVLFSCLLLSASIFSTVEKANAAPEAKNPAYYELKVYHYNSSEQEATIDSFLQYQYVPYLHSVNLKNIGVFKALSNDTAADKKLYVFIPFKSLKQWEDFETNATSDKSTIDGTGTYVNAAYNKPAYSRMETIFIRQFELAPEVGPSKLTGPKSERVYELRSYEGPTEKIHRNKVHMFNQGGEIPLFARLNFNAVFYGEVIFGSKMPNLMYMTTFENMASREEHWKAFNTDPAWKTLSSKPEYQHNVSHADINFLRPTEYSDL